jgi:hypothetical protein
MSLGGENGTTGYKFTEEQKNNLMEATKHLPNVRKKVYIYDIIEKKYLTFEGFRNACNTLGHIEIRYLSSERYLSSYSLDELEILKQKYIENQIEKYWKIIKSRQRIILKYYNKQLKEKVKGYYKIIKGRIGKIRHYNAMIASSKPITTIDGTFYSINDCKRYYNYKGKNNYNQFNKWLLKHNKLIIN